MLSSPRSISYFDTSAVKGLWFLTLNDHPVPRLAGLIGIDPAYVVILCVFACVRARTCVYVSEAVFKGSKPAGHSRSCDIEIERLSLETL